MRVRKLYDAVGYRVARLVLGDVAPAIFEPKTNIMKIARCPSMAFLSAFLSSCRAFSSSSTRRARSDHGHMKRMKEAGVVGIDRPIHIVGEQAVADKRSDEKDLIASKLVHFQRHGMGYHNMLALFYQRQFGRSIDLDDTNPETNPLLAWDIMDSPLTERGRVDYIARGKDTAKNLSPEVVFVSPLHRTLQTALLTFREHYYERNIPLIAHEGVREQLGLLQCNRRRPVSEASLEFPQIDFSLVTNDADTLWKPGKREDPRDETDRIYHFLTDFLMNRPEKEIAVVGRLFAMCNAVVDLNGNDDMKSMFVTSEIRSMRVSFYHG